MANEIRYQCSNCGKREEMDEDDYYSEDDL
jgi:DNA-directed RNA polymerase subunit RPC12/RpoP